MRRFRPSPISQTGGAPEERQPKNIRLAPNTTMARSGGLLGDPRGLDKARPRTWRRRLIRLVSLGVVVYAANALLGLAEPALSSGQIRGVSSSGDPDCVRGGVQCDAKPASPTIDAVALRLPDPDPSSGKSR